MKVREKKREFGRMSDVTGHIKAVHGEQKDYKCPECGREFAQKTTLARHVKNAHK